MRRIGRVWLSAGQSKTPKDRHTARFENNSLRERNTLAVALKRTTDTYTLGMIPAKTGMSSVHLLEGVDEPRRRQIIRREPPAQIPKRPHNTEDDSANGPQPHQHAAFVQRRWLLVGRCVRISRHVPTLFLMRGINIVFKSVMTHVRGCARSNPNVDCCFEVNILNRILTDRPNNDSGDVRPSTGCYGSSFFAPSSDATVIREAWRATLSGWNRSANSITSVPADNHPAGSVTSIISPIGLNNYQGAVFRVDGRALCRAIAFVDSRHHATHGQINCLRLTYGQICRW